MKIVVLAIILKEFSAVSDFTLALSKRMRRKEVSILIGGLLLVLLLLVTPILTAYAAPTPTPKLPKVISMTTLAVGTAKYAESSAFRVAIEKYSSMKLRLESTGTDIARVAPLKIGDCEFAYITGGLASAAARGVGPYSELGPLPIRRVWNGYPFIGAMYSRGNAGFKTIADLRGKRIPQSPGAYEWSLNNLGILAFVGLTLKDIKVVTVSSIAAALKGPLEGALDATQGSLFSSAAVELAATPHGIYWFDMPATDIEGWKRQRAVAPWANPIKTTAAGLKGGETITGAGYEDGFYSTTNVTEDIVYAFCNAMKQGYETYKDMQKGLEKWTWERAYILDLLMSDVPYHEGTVKFFKEMGVWSAAHEQFQQNALQAEKARPRK